MKHAILITHGLIGQAIIDAVRSILGVDDGLHALSVTDMSLTEITQRLLAIINSPDVRQDGVMILASLKGGSCWNVAAAIAKDHHHVRVISGINLPMALSFMTKRDLLPLEDLADVLVKDGARSVVKLEKSQPFLQR
jgi:mannose/fructose-specific phosphotransferase system component IIA